MKKVIKNCLFIVALALSMILVTQAFAQQQHQHEAQDNKSTQQQADKKSDAMTCCMKEGKMGQGMGKGMGQGMGQGQGKGQGKGMMMGGMDGRPEDMQTIHMLFENNTKITRNVRNIKNGVEALTESDDPKIQAKIAEHAYAMKKRLENRQPIRQWDPLFVALFENADKIKLEVVQTKKGVKIIETSNDPYVVKLIQSHAAGVSEFAKEGMPVMHKRHELPGAEPADNSGFLGKGDGITTCPVTGEPVNKDVKAELMGRTVYFCCENCREVVKKNPEKYLKP